MAFSVQIEFCVYGITGKAMWRRCSLLNAALVVNEKNAAKTEYLGLMSVCFWLGFAIQILVFQVCANQALVV
ncbi:hypothetical protein CGG87_23265 [Vibrio parahaemolyticus]|nr:hypothetical protein CGG87_23265 [Vibrio parahaemolyticus]